VVSFDSNGLANSGGNIYTVTLTGVKNATLSDVFSYKTLSTTISWDNMGSDNIVSKAEKASYSLSGTVSNPANLSGLQISSIVFTSLDGTQITVSSNLPVIDTNTGAWSLSHSNMPSLADGKYTVTVNFSANGGYTKSVTHAKAVVIDTVEPTLSEAEADGNTITLTMDEYLNESSIPTASDFTVDGNTVTAVAVDGNKVTLTLASAVSDTTTVNYTGSSLEDNNGNDVATFNSTIGTSGDDTIVGTSANEILTGGGGHDTYDYSSTDIGSSDIITDFTLGDASTDNSDRLDLRDLLTNYSSGDLSAWIQVTDSNGTEAGGDIVLKIDKDGSNSFDNPDTTITLKGLGGTAASLDVDTFFDSYNIMAV
ncbi:type I secretion C-terminal target domain-containing protein, partial [Poseidonibacter ostreae]